MHSTVLPGNSSVCNLSIDMPIGPLWLLLLRKLQGGKNSMIFFSSGSTQLVLSCVLPVMLFWSDSKGLQRREMCFLLLFAIKPQLQRAHSLLAVFIKGKKKPSCSLHSFLFTPYSDKTHYFIHERCWSYLTHPFSQNKMHTFPPQKHNGTDDIINTV